MLKQLISLFIVILNYYKNITHCCVFYFLDWVTAPHSYTMCLVIWICVEFATHDYFYYGLLFWLFSQLINKLPIASSKMMLSNCFFVPTVKTPQIFNLLWRQVKTGNPSFSGAGSRQYLTFVTEKTTQNN